MAIAIPAHDEAEAIGEFISEIDDALATVAEAVTFVVVDDASNDDTSEAVERVRSSLRGQVVLVRNETNLGHGPTVLEAYRRSLETGADLVLQVDGDGQFLGSDLRRIAVLLEDGADAVCGVRRFRFDPWFRMLMTRAVRLYVSLGFGLPTRDANCPLRGFRSGVLDDLLRWVPEGALVPNLYLTILAARRGVTVVEVDVHHRVRRGTSAVGTMFRGASRRGVPMRLIKFSGRALVESTGFHRHLNSGRGPAVSAARRSPPSGP